jgi:hypothetical protein
MRNSLKTARELSACDHSHPLEVRLPGGQALLRCSRCGASTESPPGAEDTHRASTWTRPTLVERLLRDLAEEVPAMLLELEDADRACDEIIRSLEEIRSLARGAQFEIDAEALTGILDAARACRSAVQRLRVPLERDRA